MKSELFDESFLDDGISELNVSFQFVLSIFVVVSMRRHIVGVNVLVGFDEDTFACNPSNIYLFFSLQKTI